MDTEVVRARYRPPRIATLFVGEAPPASGKFFYCGNTALAHHMRAAMLEAGLGGDGNFLGRFKEQGWYLDDLVLQPVDRLRRSERQPGGTRRQPAWLFELTPISRERLSRCCWE